MEYNNQTIIAALLGIGLLCGAYMNNENIILTVCGALAGILTTNKMNNSSQIQSEPQNNNNMDCVVESDDGGC